VALTKAFLAVEGDDGKASSRIREVVAQLTATVVSALMRRLPAGGTVTIEAIQDQVELALMRAGEHDVASAYVLYRQKRAEQRAVAKNQPVSVPLLHVLDGGQRRPLEPAALLEQCRQACQSIPDVSPETVLQQTWQNLYDDIPMAAVRLALVLAARTLIEHDPGYSQVAARLLLNNLRTEVLGEEVEQQQMRERYPQAFLEFIPRGIAAGLLEPRLKDYDLPRLAAALQAEQDWRFDYLGLQTLYDRYFLHIEEQRIELPQLFFMRVAMGLAINEVDRETRAIEFYQVLSNFDFMSSTPTLFNSGTRHPQLSSCYLTTVADDLEDIFQSVKENALLQKYAGGLGNDWTPVRALGSRIKGTNGKSQGVIPFLKVVNDTAVAVNQCFAPDTLMHTADGVKTIREVKKGDLVLGISGAYREVTQTMVYEQHEPMVALTVKHAVEPIKVTAGHPFWAMRGVPLAQSHDRTLNGLAKGKVKLEWVEAGQLQQGDYVAQVIPTETVPVADFTDEDARLYGILLGDGQLSKDGMQWGVSGNPQNGTHLHFVRDYLAAQGVHFWETGHSESGAQIHWASGRGVVCNASNGRIVGGDTATMPFSHDDLYNAQGEKHIARRFSHLPRPQTLALVQGLLETDGGVSRGKDIYFTSTSRALAEGLRYQCLRLGVPTSGQYRERDTRHSGITKAIDIRIPAVPEIAALVNGQALTKRNGLQHKGWLFSRVCSVETIPTTPFVCDLIVEGDESYMTTAALAHNGGKRKGAVCAYLETWHLDFEEFLELRKNTGDERRRTHDMNTASWIPDLFMQRVIQQGDWTLFSPDDTPDLHDKIGKNFERAYTDYESRADRGEIKLFKRLPAVQLWRKMLTQLFETGHPWITFKDACNIRSPQQHVGVVHSSNLCTEITLNTSATETAVCNLGSVNLPAHLVQQDGGWQLDADKLQRTIRTAMRMLDNVVDINFYATPKARNANVRHRPVGLGIMGFADCLQRMGLAYASAAAVEFADASMEMVCYRAYWASTELAEERGRYSSFTGSLWDKGILPLDSLKWLEVARDGSLDANYDSRLDWDALKARMAQHGMRNSNCTAIAPTATISNIVGVSASIEPDYQNLYVKSNLSGEFTVINAALVKDLKALGLWDELMVSDLKYFDGSLAAIDRIPANIKARYATAFEIDPVWLIEAGARRQKWIDQSQSLNLYVAQPSGKKLDEIYKLAWRRGLKTTYYLRTLGATAMEKVSSSSTENSPKACSIIDPECEACQ
jgi:ribonucleoside-diphosphate reductase alpha chain